MKTLISSGVLFLAICTCQIAHGRTMTEYNGRVLKKDREYYTVQIASAQFGEHQSALAVHDSLKERGYLAFYGKGRLENRATLPRVCVGYFDDAAAAAEFGRQIREKEQLEYFVGKAQLVIVTHSNDFSIIQTPSAIWLSKDEEITELFDLSPAIFDHRIGARYTQPFISPSGREVLLEYDRKIIQLDLRTRETSVLGEKVANALPQRSPSGRYVGYIDQNIWESKSGLWIIKEDQTHVCLVDARNSDKEVAVKFFRWHPEKDIILFVEGFAFGTVTVGGNIYSVDMDGARKLLLASDISAGEEIVSEFDVEANVLKYQVARFDSNRSRIAELVEHKRALSDLLP